MCRLFAFSFHKDTAKDSRVLCVNSFKALSLEGAVLPASIPGHGDGWGITVYSSTGDLSHHHRSIAPAHLDETFKGELFFKDEVSQSGLVHLRKKTVGEASLCNTHPFVDDRYSFIHNGTISHVDSYPDLAHACAGDTDSERLFRRFLAIKRSSEIATKDAYISMIEEARNVYPTYSALNTILHDGEHIYVSRCINMNNKHFKESDLLDYYTLYLGLTPQGDVLISSQVVEHTDIVYQLVPNNSVSVISVVTGSIHTEHLR